MNLIFLAAGNSTRFGSNKLLYRLNGKCMYRYGLEVVAALWQKGLLDTIVIVTQYEEIIYDIEAHFPYMKTVNNPHPEAGISGSIRLAYKYYEELKKLEGDVGGKCVLKKHLDDVQMFEMPASELKDLDSLTEIHE